MEIEDKRSINHEEQQANHLKSREKSEHRRNLRKPLKGQRRNLKPSGPRDKNWNYGTEDEWDDAKFEQRQRIMPLDERDRRRSLEAAAYRRPNGASNRRTDHCETPRDGFVGEQRAMQRQSEPARP